MAEEVQLEKEKVRKKEEMQLQQIAEMRRKIEEANASAVEIKRGKRNIKRVQPEEPPEPVHLHPQNLETKRRCNPQVVVIINLTMSCFQGSNKLTFQFEPSQTVEEESPAPPPAQHQQVVQTSTNIQTSSVPLRQTVRYVSNAGTQTVCEVSCQTTREESLILPSESKLIQLKERELSVVQRSQPPSRKEAAQKQSKSRSSIPKPVQKKPPEKPKVEYDKNGRRIRPKKEAQPLKEPPLSYTISEKESVAVTDYESIADILDDPRRMM